MHRSDFLRLVTAGGLMTGFSQSSSLIEEMKHTIDKPIPRRPYRSGDSLSIIGFGGILCLGRTQKEVSDLVSEMYEKGINYFDVAPSYGNGEAEERLGPALEPYRSKVFLACKTMSRDGGGARTELERSLQRMRTDHFDLYQFHAITSMKEVEEVFAPGGALEPVVRARDNGQIRHIGFSAHSEEAALSMLGRFSFDSILFPCNIVCATNGNFGPRVLEQARNQGVARLALKAMAYSPWPARGDHPYPKCWYRPIDDPALARLALRYTLGEDVTAAIAPGEESLFRIALEEATRYTPLSSEERQDLIRRISGIPPIFKTST